MAWDLSAISTGMPVSEAARRILRSAIDQMQVAAEHLLDKDDDENEVESVHKLRVWSRRAGAALDLFANEFEESLLKRTRKKLKKLRRAAGETRDLDVLLKRLREAQVHHDAESLQRADQIAIESLRRIRKKRRAELIQTLRKLERKSVWLWWRRKLVDQVSASGVLTGSLNHQALKILPGEILDFLTHLRRENFDWESIHELRIAGKHLRYSLEIMSRCFEPKLIGSSLDALCAFQDRLGALNDSYNAERQIRRLAKNEISDHRRDALKSLAKSFRSDRKQLASPTDFKDPHLDSILTALMTQISEQSPVSHFSGDFSDRETEGKVVP